jgi:hypothetical protein
MDKHYEKVLPQYGPQKLLLSSGLFRVLLRGLFKITGNGRLAEQSRTLRPMSPEELHELMKVHNDLSLKMKAKWEEAGI